MKSSSYVFLVVINIIFIVSGLISIITLIDKQDKVPSENFAWISSDDTYMSYSDFDTNYTYKYKSSYAQNYVNFVNWSGNIYSDKICYEIPCPQENPNIINAIYCMKCEEGEE